MKTKVLFPLLAVAGMFVLASAQDASAFEFFRRGHSGGCCNDCCAPEPTCCAAEPTCCAAEPTCCAEESCCDPCGDSCCDTGCCERRRPLRDFFRRLCHRNKCCESSCCESSCDSCCESSCEPTCCGN